MDNTSRFHIYKVISADTKDTINVLSYGETIIKPFSMIHDTLYLEENSVIGSAYKRVR
jgi:hypothetical protein